MKNSTVITSILLNTKRNISWKCAIKIKKLEESKPIFLEHTKFYDDKVAQ